MPVTRFEDAMVASGVNVDAIVNEKDQAKRLQMLFAGLEQAEIEASYVNSIKHAHAHEDEHVVLCETTEDLRKRHEQHLHSFAKEIDRLTEDIAVRAPREPLHGTSCSRAPNTTY